MKQNSFNDDVKNHFKKMRGYEVDGLVFYCRKDFEYYIRKKIEIELEKEEELSFKR
jgi:hypothetical protein